MRYAVGTGELRGAAGGLTAVSASTTALLGSLRSQRGAVDGWAAGRARTQAHAFFATLLDGLASVAVELDDLARSTSTAAGAYEETERAADPRAR